jgi:hypothetical protein
MSKHTGITQRSAEDGFAHAFAVDANHMSAYGSLGMRSAFYHQGFETPSGRWLEVWWTVDQRTGQVTDIFEDTRGLNRR